jgi:hypothetical protein
MTADASPPRWCEGEVVHLDVRGLPPPQPLVAILRLLREQGDSLVPVVVHLERDPLMLYPHLAEIGWVAECVSAEPGAVVLRLEQPP